MRPRYGRSLKRTGDLISSSEANATGALELNVDPVDEDATTSRDGICGDEVSRTLFPPEDGAERPICASLSEDEGGPSIVASIPADSSRATISSASSRGRLSSRTSAHVLVSVSRSEEHTSELQSQSNLVCRLLLEKKKKKKKKN